MTSSHDANRPARPARRAWRVVVPLAALAAAAVWHFATADSAAPDTPDQAPPLTVDAPPIVMQDSIPLQRDFSGNLEARRTSDLAFLRTGRLVAYRVNEGDAVRAGDVIAELDVRSLSAQRTALAAERAAAQALLSEMVAGPRPETIDQARARVAARAAARDRAKLTYERMQRARERDAITPEEFDRAQFDYEARRAEYDEAAHALAELESGTRDETILAQRALVEQLDARLATIDVDLADSRIVAPYDGTIDVQRVDPGAIVTPGVAVTRIVESGMLEAWIGIPDASLDAVSVGAPVTLTINGEPHAAHVRAIMPQTTTTTRTTPVIFALDHAGAAHPGALARFTLNREIPKRHAALPVEALIRGQNGLWSLYVVETDTDGAAHVRRAEVEVLHTDGATAYVRGMISDGDRVIQRGAHRLVPGQRVELGVLAR